MSSGVSLIVPVLDDTAAVSVLLERVAAWPRAPREIVIVSGARDAELARLCAAHGCQLIETAANRGAQLDRGAAAASSPLLWFVHADTQPPELALAAIEQAVATGAESGCFRFDFQGPPQWRKSLLARLVALRIHMGGMPYGDQSLFVLRDVYAQCGGFAHQPLFEEVELVRRLRHRGTFRALPGRIRVSTRRWERDGWWSRSCHNRWLALCHMLGVPAQRLAGAYSRPRTRTDIEP